MAARTGDAHKLTVSLPVRLVEYADRGAASLGTSRSAVIAAALAELQNQEEAELATEGYTFYSAESADFAASSLTAISEALQDGG